MVDSNWPEFRSSVHHASRWKTVLRRDMYHAIRAEMQLVLVCKKGKVWKRSFLKRSWRQILKSFKYPKRVWAYNHQGFKKVQTWQLTCQVHDSIHRQLHALDQDIIKLKKNLGRSVEATAVCTVHVQLWISWIQIYLLSSILKQTFRFFVVVSKLHTWLMGTQWKNKIHIFDLAPIFLKIGLSWDTVTFWKSGLNLPTLKIFLCVLE